MRIEGWESKLFSLIEEARHVPYQLGAHDCVKLVCGWIATVTGEANRWPEIEGYRTRDEAIALIKAHGSTFEEAFSWLFRRQDVDVRLARRGDVCSLQLQQDGMKHLGLCVGAKIALLAEGGLTFYPLDRAQRCWRID